MSTDAEMVRGQLAMGAIEAHRALDRLAAAEARAEAIIEVLREHAASHGCACAALAAVTPTEAAE